MIIHKFHTQQGSVLTEFVIVTAFIFLPLWLMIPFLLELIDTRHTTEQAARYASWERIAWFPAKKSPNPSFRAVKSDTQIGYEVVSRILQGDSDSALHSEQKNAPRSAVSTQVSIESGSINGVGSQLVTTALNMTGILGFSLNTGGLYTSQLSIDVAEPSWLRDSGIDLRIETQHALLTDAWSAGGSDHNAALVRRLMPTALLDNQVVNTGLRIIAHLPIARELHPDKFRLGHVDVDAVPEHRLRPYQK